jgi:hypothetical protein
VRLSISARVSIACALVIVLSTVLLATALGVANEIHQADQRITALTHALQIEDQHDQAQRNLRRNVGDATRDAEHGAPVAIGRWAELWQQAADLERLSSCVATSCLKPEAGIASVPIREARRATFAFVRQTRDLMRVARSNPLEVKAAMPRFLSALRKSEASRSGVRDRLVRDIGLAAERHGRESRRTMLHRQRPVCRHPTTC